MFRTLRKFAPRSILEDPGTRFWAPFGGHSGGLGLILGEFLGIFFEVIFVDFSDPAGSVVNRKRGPPNHQLSRHSYLFLEFSQRLWAIG